MIPVDSNKPWKKVSFKTMTDPKLNIWCQDFTYLKYQNQWLYLATIIDLATRRIMGWSIGYYHDANLVCQALENALNVYSPPTILHDDQGSEYLSFKMKNLCQSHNITLSCTSPHSPWQNGFKESFYSNFKAELGSLNSFTDLALVLEHIGQTIFYYNNKRIHTALKMSPQAYANKLEGKSNNFRIDKLLQKIGG